MTAKDFELEIIRRVTARSVRGRSSVIILDIETPAHIKSNEIDKLNIVQTIETMYPGSACFLMVCKDTGKIVGVAFLSKKSRSNVWKDESYLRFHCEEWKEVYDLRRYGKPRTRTYGIRYKTWTFLEDDDKDDEDDECNPSRATDMPGLEVFPQKDSGDEKTPLSQRLLMEGITEEEFLERLYDVFRPLPVP